MQISQILSVKLSLHDNFGSFVLVENAPRSKQKVKDPDHQVHRTGRSGYYPSILKSADL